MRVTFVPDPEADDALERAELLLTLRKRGIRDPLLMRAFEQVPRERFVDPACRSLAWVDQALPISCGQTISQPAVVALMTEALDLKPSHSVLEVGTGSGYHAAILGQIAERVVTVERFRTLAQTAAERLKRLGYTNIEVVVADGSAGYAPRAPYDRIIITAAVNEVPPRAVRPVAAGRGAGRPGRPAAGHPDAHPLRAHRRRHRQARDGAGALRAAAEGRGAGVVREVCSGLQHPSRLSALPLGTSG